jgi:uncharacterized protein DUF5317
MLIVVGAVLVASLVAGFALGGRIHRLGDFRFRGAPLAIAALAIMVVETSVDFGRSADRTLVAAAYALIALFLLVNLLRSRGALKVGIGLFAIGWVLNASVMIANGGMPLSLAAYESSGQSGQPTPGEGGFFKIVIADQNTVMRPLGDVIALKPFGRVVSAGDLVLLAGLSLTVVAGMRGAGAPSAALDSRVSPAAATA